MIKTRTIQLTLIILVFTMLLPNCFTVTNLGYRDNKCSANFQSATILKTSTISTTNSPVDDYNLQATYTQSCADGVNFSYTRTSHLGTFKSVWITDPMWNLSKAPASVSYNGSSNSFVFNLPSNTYGGIDESKTDPFYSLDPLNYTYWAAKSSATLSRDDRAAWELKSDAVASNSNFEKYDPSKFKVEQVFPKEYSAFPFDNSLSTKEDPSSQTPRAFLKISSIDNPKYFATIYSFPGAGDNDMYGRPLIVGDAFDPGDERDAFQIYNNPRYSSLLGLNGNSPRAKGYDVFFLDFSQGGGDMHLNAMIELKLISWLTTKTSKKMIVGGPSMSGLIARLALLYSLPNNNIPPTNSGPIDLGKNVKGYLSIDSPQQGANISPYFLSAILNLISNNYVQFDGSAKGNLKTYRNTLNAPAAHQMLYEHYYNSPSEISESSKLDFYRFLTRIGNYRYDIPRVAIAYSNFYHHSNDGIATNQRIKQLGTSGIYRDILGNKYEWDAGSTTQETYWDLFTGERASYSANNFYFSNPSEVSKGCFIPIYSALDLTGFDTKNPPTLDEKTIKNYSPFNSVYYMKNPYNGYCSASGTCSLKNQCESTSGCRQTPDDKRYQHIIFDNQLMTAIASGLDDIERMNTSRNIIPAINLLLQ